MWMFLKYWKIERKKNTPFTIYIQYFRCFICIFEFENYRKKSTLTGYLICIPNVAGAQEHPYMLSSVNFIHFFVSLISRWIEQRLFHWVCVHPKISIRIDSVLEFSWSHFNLNQLNHSHISCYLLNCICLVVFLYYCVVFHFFSQLIFNSILADSFMIRSG